MANKIIDKLKGPVTAEDIHPQAPVDKIKESLRQYPIPNNDGNQSVFKEMADKLKSFTTDNIFAGGTLGDSPNE